MKPAPQSAGEWFARRRAGPMSAEEAAALDAWLAAGPERRAEFARIEQAWAEVEALRRAPEVLALRARARGRLAGLTRAAAANLAAACLIVAVMAGGAWGLKVSGLLPFGRFTDQAYATAVGERTAVTLPDGSVVTLNTDSRLRTVAAQGRRVVYLDKGQAFFRVAKDADRPFVVHAAGRTVTALGTAFDVRVEGERFEVMLVEGKVRVEAPMPPPPPAPALAAGAAPEAPSPPPQVAVRSTEMLAGDQLVASRGDHWTVARADASAETSWLSGWLKFEGEPLGAVAAEFGRYSQRRIVIEDAGLAARAVSGAFRADDEKAFAEALEAAGLARIAAMDEAVIRLAPPSANKKIAAGTQGLSRTLSERK